MSTFGANNDILYLSMTSLVTGGLLLKRIRYIFQFTWNDSSLKNYTLFPFFPPLMFEAGFIAANKQNKIKFNALKFQ